MDVIIIGAFAFFASLLTFFSGFGLGTILTPVFAVFFPPQIAVAQTSIVHFLNNVFKLFLIGKHANRKIILAFGIPAILGAIGGSYALLLFSQSAPVLTYIISEKEFFITPLKLAIGSMIIVFSLAELVPAFAKRGFAKDNLTIGGLFSGFFGGLSGHQGALRSAFLIHYNLEKEEYVATGTVIACIIDVTRISLYISFFYSMDLFQNGSHIIIAALCAMTGAVAGNFLLRKSTLRFVQLLTQGLLIILALAIGSGLI